MSEDDKIKIQDLKDLLLKFRDERDWAQFHDPKNLAEAISIEAAELQELFLWKSEKEISEKFKNNPEYRKEVEEELADVIINSINFANATNIDISKVIREKIEKNNRKYPAEKAKGRADKYDKL